MKTIFNVRLNSVICPLLSSDGMVIKSEFQNRFYVIRERARINYTDVEFIDDKAIFVGCCQRTFKVPTKCTKDFDYLLNWISKKIDFVNK